MAEAKIKAVITADDRASSVLRGFDNRVGRLGRTVGNILRKGLIVAGAAVAGLTAFVWKSVKAFGEEEAVIARLQAGIKNVTSARNHNIKALLDQASALQRLTRFADEEIISAQGVLSTFQLNQQAIEKLTPRLLDMSEGIARVSGGLPDLEGNAILVAKALGGEDITGLAGALRRVGVIMTTTQMEVLKTGNMQQRLAVITQVLDQNYKGLAKEIGGTTLGRIAQFQHALGDLQEHFGAVIAKALTPFIQKLTAWAQTDKARQVMQTIATRIVQVGTAFANFIKNNWPSIKEVLKGIGSFLWAIVVAIGAVIRAVKALGDAYGRVLDKLQNKGPGAAFKTFGPFILPSFNQMGGNISAGHPAVVGEAGPEMIVPKRDSTVIPNHQLGGSTINFNVNIGMFAGNPMERRQIAETLYRDLADVASSKGISLSTMIGRA